MTTAPKSGNLFLFTDAGVGHQHGYYDGWVGDVFHYVGRGQTGDQVMDDMNLALNRHASRGLTVRLFRGARGMTTYLGEFELDRDHAYYRMDAPETGTKAFRQVIVFRLAPRGLVVHDSSDDRVLPEGMTPEELDSVVTSSVPAKITLVPVEAQHVAKMSVNPPPRWF